MGRDRGALFPPVLYALSIEPLAVAIRNSIDTIGVKVSHEQLKVSLFADDVLLTITNPILTLPSLHNLLEEYSRLSGYKINLSKMEALPIQLPQTILQNLQSKFKYKWRSNL